MKLVVGLGNIGPNFDGTRHNTGFSILDAFATAKSFSWAVKDKLKSTLAEGELHGQKVILAKPTTYYNLSGESVRAIKDFYKLDNQDILVVHDELALPFGTIRVRLDGTDAGNNGIKSVVSHAGSDIARIRVGIANDQLPQFDAADFVLARFTHNENKTLPALLNEASRLIEQFIDQNQKFEHLSVRIDTNLEN